MDIGENILVEEQEKIQLTEDRRLQIVQHGRVMDQLMGAEAEARQGMDQQKEDLECFACGIHSSGWWFMLSLNEN